MLLDPDLDPLEDARRALAVISAFELYLPAVQATVVGSLVASHDDPAQAWSEAVTLLHQVMKLSMSQAQVIVTNVFALFGQPLPFPHSRM